MLLVIVVAATGVTIFDVITKVHCCYYIAANANDVDDKNFIFFITCVLFCSEARASEIKVL